MKVPPTNPSEFGARVICALIDDLHDRKSRSFERTDALRHVVKGMKR